MQISDINITRAGHGINYLTSYSGSGCAEIENVNFSNITMQNTGIPLIIEGDVGYIKNCTIQNVTATSLGGITFNATNECEISGITVNNFELNVIPDSRDITAFKNHLLNLRGTTLLKVVGIKTSTLNNLTIVVDENVISTWKKSIEQENCQDFNLINCSLPQI